jgi:membrane protein DedA with SNARE-associated domain
VTGVSAYGLGLLYGRAAFGWLEQRSPRLARFVAWVERLFARWGVWLLVLAPAPTVALFAGAARSRFIAFVIAVALGHALWISLTIYVGDAFAVWTDRLTHFVGEHLLESTLVCIALVTVQQAWSRRRRRQVGLSVPPS